jgi:DNA polymerase-3 subunit epsilon
MLDRPLVFLDLETTGAAAPLDRITEIGLIELSGAEVLGEWSQLVNPLRSIPPEIQGLTGITDDMVANAPSFEELASELFARLAGKVLVAHNARFDYGFLRQEFRRAGYRYVAAVLCTVKLSRKLYPQERRHNLDALLERHQLTCEARHRALPDARVLLEFAQRLDEQFGPQTVRSAAEELLRPPALPPGLPPDALEDVPDSPGVYVFYSENNAPLYLSRTGILRTRMLAHFAGDSRRDVEISNRVRRVDWVETTGEFGAAIREIALLATMQPEFNRKPRGSELLSFRWNPVDGPLRPTLVEVSGQDVSGTQDVFGLFRSKAVANNALRGLADKHRLCLIALGLDSGSGACYNYALKKCKGLCVGAEDERLHTARLAAALAPLRIRPWPFKGPIGLRETDPYNGRSQVHLFDRWSYLGTADTPPEISGILETRREVVFDAEIYKLLRRLLREQPRSVQIAELPGAR